MLFIIHALNSTFFAVSMQRGFPDSKVHGAHIGPIWGRQDPGGPYVGPMNFWPVLKYMRMYGILYVLL